MHRTTYGVTRKKTYIEKVFIVTFPHRANLFPEKNSVGQTIHYKVNVSNIVEKILFNYDNVEHINFTSEIIGKEKYIYDNAYIDFDPHLNEQFHEGLFAKTIMNRLEEFLISK